MTEHEAFLQAIIAEPDEDAPRLIYADWLEEHGDPRGEFIRVQCALARPGRKTRWADLKAREQTLLAEYRKEWIKPLRGIWKMLRFRRGFVEGMTLTVQKFLERSERLFRLAPVRDVRLIEIDHFMVPALAACPHLAFLRGLSLSLGGLTDHTFPTLAASPHLARLTAFNFSSNYLGPDGIRALVKSRWLSGLTALDVGNSALEAAGVEILAATPAVARLTTLNLSFNVLGDAGLVALAESPHLAGLTTLSLCQTGVGDAGIWALATSPHLRRLTKLSLRRNHFSAAGALALAESPSLARLTRLDLAGNNLDQQTRQALRERFRSRVLFAESRTAPQGLFLHW
jgi:uncharacterized protein (TIGR02996 family)